MSLPRFETPAGAIDGVNAVFTFSEPYTPGTVALYLNGQLMLHPLGNSWTETDPGAGIVTVDAELVPQTGDTLAGFYLDTTDSIVVEVVHRLVGELTGPMFLDGQLGPMALSASLEPVVDLDGSLAPFALEGSVEAAQPLVGTLEDC